MNAEAREIDLDASITRLGDTALRIKAERDTYRAALRDIVFGADVMLQIATGSSASYAKETKRVAEVALGKVTR